MEIEPDVDFLPKTNSNITNNTIKTDNSSYFRLARENERAKEVVNDWLKERRQKVKEVQKTYNIPMYSSKEEAEKRLHEWDTYILGDTIYRIYFARGKLISVRESVEDYIAIHKLVEKNKKIATSVREPVKKEKEVMSNVNKNKKTIETDRQTLIGDNFSLEKNDDSVFIEKTTTVEHQEEDIPFTLNENEIIQDDELSEINSEDIDFSTFKS